MQHVRRAANVAILAVILLAGCSHGGLFGGRQQSDAADTPTRQITVTFDKAPIDQTPDGFVTALTGPGPAGAWVVVEDGTAPAGTNVLAQTDPDPTRARFPLCVYQGLKATDVDVSVLFRAISGRVDQAAGLVVRYQDQDNYYITRANALENNVRLYRVVAGKRTQFATADLPVTAGQWHSLRLVAEGTHFKVFYNDKLVIEAEDATFQAAGKIGLWTKADSVTHFDDLVIRPLKP